MPMAGSKNNSPQANLCKRYGNFLLHYINATILGQISFDYQCLFIQKVAAIQMLCAIFNDHSTLKIILILILTCQTFFCIGQISYAPKVISYTNKKFHKIYSTTQISWERQVRYLGKYKDTLKIDSLNYRFRPENNPFGTAKAFRKFYGQEFSLTPLLISIDTSQTIFSSDFCEVNGNFKTKSFESFPLFIQNLTDSFASIGFGSKVNVIVQALDTDKIWKPIESSFIYKCGNGLHLIYLEPKEFLCTLIPKYTGSYFTQLRLKLNNSYSDIYWGKINPSQFVSSSAAAVGTPHQSSPSPGF